MDLKGIYSGLEDKYFGLVDWLDKKGISLYPLIDAIESKNIPSFPVMALIGILILALVIWLALSIVAPTASISVLVTDSEDNSPLAGAEVTVYFGGQSASAITREDGKAVFNVPSGSGLTVSVTKDGYREKTETFTATASMEKAISLLKEIAMLSKTIQLMNSSTNELLKKPVTINFSCSNAESDFSQDKTTDTGTIELQVPANCGNLLARPVSGFTVENGVISLDDAASQLRLQEAETETGTINVYVEDAAGAGLAGVTVRLLKNDGIEQSMEYTSTAGSVSFANVPTGSYYVIAHDRQGSYADYDSSLKGEVKSLLKDATLEFTVVMSESVAGKIKVRVKDSQGNQVVVNAEVKLKKDNTVRDEQYTDSKGEAEFSVQESIAYNLEVNHPDYLIAALSSVRPGETFNEILLEPATSSNSSALVVEVKDTKGLPIDGVRLVLKKSDGTVVGDSKVTGFDGKAEFTNLKLETYYVYAAKKGFQGKNSNPIAIQARQENKISIVLDIGFGDIEIKALDEKGEAVQGAAVTMQNAVTKQKEGETTTGEDGIALFNVRADKLVFFIVDAEGFLPYNTVAISANPNAKITREVRLVKDVTKLEVELLGLFSGEEKTFGRTVAPGQTYIAKLILKVPKRSNFNFAGIHLRTGNSEEDRVNIMEEDDLYIRDVKTGTLDIKRGTSYYPPKGYAEDSKHLTVGDSKWVSIEWKDVTQGVYELEAEIVVKENAALGELLKVFYRAWGRTGAYIRYPADAELGSAEATSKKEALYANAILETYTVGPTNLCDSFFCKSFTIEDLSNNTKMRVVTEYPATLGNNYKLRFSINSIGEKPLPNSEIVFGSESDGLKFTNYQIVDALGSAISGVANAYDLSKPVGSLVKGSVVSGLVEFITEKDGSNKLTITIKSDGTPSFDEAINVQVAPAQQLQMDILPKEIVPLIDNLLLVKVSDESGNAVSNAIVTIKLNDEVIFSSQTNAGGEVSYELEAPAPGQALKIKAQKNGYKDIETAIAIDDSILLVTPPSISQELSAAAFENEVGMLLSNYTAVEQKIEDIKVSNTFKDLVEFNFSEDYIGKNLGVNTDENMFVTIKLTSSGFLVDKPTTLKGALSIYTKANDIERTFVTNIPVEVRIGLGGEVDDPKCLSITPSKWEIITSSDSKKSIELELANDCKVNGNAIPLRKLQVRLKTKEDNLLGEFVLSSEDIPDAATVEIGTDFKVIVPQLPAEFTGKVKIEFTPENDVESAEAEYDIELKALNTTEKGEEAIESELKTHVLLSNLTKCLKVIAPDPIIIETSPWNLGYGRYSQFGYDPYSNGGWGGYGGYSGYGSGYGGYGGYGGGYTEGSIYPYSNFDASYYSRYFNNPDETAWKYGLGQNSFRIENTCTIPVEIELEVPPQLKTSETKFSMDPQESKDMAVESGYRLGKYSIDVKARAEGSKDKFVKISIVDVIVKRLDEIDEDCIKLVPTKIKLNDFLGRPQPAKIYNYCYDSGVLLYKTDEVITFKCQVPGQPTNVFNFAAAGWQSIELQGGYIPSGPSGPSSGGVYSPYENYANNGFAGSGYYNYPYGNQSSGQYYPGGQYPYGSSGWGYAASGYEGTCPLIDSIYITDERKTGGEEGKIVQEIAYEVRPNIQYRKQLCQYIGQLPFQTIYGLRLTISGAYYRSVVRAAAEVRYRTAFGGSDVAYFPVMLEDLWGLGETLDECIAKAGGGMPQECWNKINTQGNPVAPVEACINKGALDSTKQWTLTKGFIPNSEFTGDIYEFIPADDVLQIMPSACGGLDYLQNVRGDVSKNGVTVTFTTAENCGKDWKIKATINRSGMTSQCVTIETMITADIVRPSTWSAPKKVTIPVKISVVNKGVDPATVDPKTCEGTKPGEVPGVPPEGKITKCTSSSDTGEGVFKKYGFDKLLLDWRPEAVAKTDGTYVCDALKKEDGTLKDGKDAVNKFCDAVQFSIELNKEGKEIKEKITDWKDNGRLASDAVVKAATGCNDTADAKENKCSDYKNTANLYRWVKKQIKVKDDVSGKDQVFFLGTDGALLKETRKAVLEALGGALKDVKQISGGSDYRAIVEKTDAALNSIANNESSKKYKDFVVAKLTGLDCDNIYNKQCTEIGIEKPKDYNGTEIKSYYIMTFNEYQRLHNKLWEALKSNGKCYSSADCTSGPLDLSTDTGDKSKANCCNITPDKTEIKITSQFLTALVNSNLEFTVAVQHVKDTAEVDRVIKEAGDVADLGITFKDWYYKDVNFDAFLIVDGYYKELRDAFSSDEKYKDLTTVTKYSDWGVKGTGLKDTEKTALKYTGGFNILINYDWSGDGKFTLELYETQKDGKKLANIDSSYAKNLFFNIPFDGMLGESSRNKYGVSFKNTRLAYVSYDKDRDEKWNMKFFDSTGGIKEMNFTYGEKFADTISGAVVTVTEDKFTYVPSVPVVLRADLYSRTEGAEGMLYNLLDELQNVVSGQSSTVFWKMGSSSPFSDSKTAVNTAQQSLCKEISQEYYGFVRNLSGEEIFKGVVFVPAGHSHYLQFHCAQRKAEVSSKVNDNSVGNIDIAGYRTGGALLKLNEPQDLKAYALDRFINEINSGNMCVDTSGDKLKLIWYAEKFLE